MTAQPIASDPPTGSSHLQIARLLQILVSVHGLESIGPPTPKNVADDQNERTMVAPPSRQRLGPITASRRFVGDKNTPRWRFDWLGTQKAKQRRCDRSPASTSPGQTPFQRIVAVFRLAIGRRPTRPSLRALSPAYE